MPLEDWGIFMVCARGRHARHTRPAARLHALLATKAYKNKNRLCPHSLPGIFFSRESAASLCPLTHVRRPRWSCGRCGRRWSDSEPRTSGVGGRRRAHGPCGVGGLRVRGGSVDRSRGPVSVRLRLGGRYFRGLPLLPVYRRRGYRCPVGTCSRSRGGGTINRGGTLNRT